MSNPLVLLLLELIGAAIALIGLVMLIRKPLNLPHRRLRAPIILFTLGAGLTTAAWLVRPTPDAQGVEHFNQLLHTASTAAGQTAPARYKRIGILVDSTPSDRAEAPPSARHAFSSQLATSLAHSVVQEGLSTQADARAYIDGSETLVPNYCQKHDLLVTIVMPAVQLPQRDDYALWREPTMTLQWCGSGSIQTQKFRALERPGDALPYEQALRNRLFAALRMASET